MKKFERIQRPPRRIKLRHREAAVEQETGSKKQVQKTVSKRRPIETYDGLLNEVAAAARAGKSISTLQNRRNLGLPPKFHRRGRNIFYGVEDIDEVWGDKD
ncbi:hypothetical protein [Sulfitobacter geojensis]|uniref:hypothetical protein n=1 Tax=Sulfitobacter geojensis TaxID=1342299 RepID=UPI003B8DEC44